MTYFPKNKFTAEQYAKANKIVQLTGTRQNFALAALAQREWVHELALEFIAAQAIPRSIHPAIRFPLWTQHNIKKSLPPEAPAAEATSAPAAE